MTTLLDKGSPPEPSGSSEPSSEPTSSSGPEQRGEPPIGNRPRAYVHAGQVHVTSKPTAISTVLGSCVAVCMWDRARHLGGMNHFLLPTCGPGRAPSERFGDVAIARLHQEIYRLGAGRGTLFAKVFGGASVVDAFQQRRTSLGDQNVEIAMTFLQNEGIPVIEKSVGGRRGRRLIFFSDTGEAWVRLL